MKTITIDGVEYNLTPIKKTKKKQEPIILEQTLKFEVYPEDLGKHSWEDAKKVCEDLGDGWRLPTREELLLIWLNKDNIWLNKDNIGGFAAAYYWSSSEYRSNYAWGQDFLFGSQDNDGEGNAFYVRAVRDVII